MDRQRGFLLLVKRRTASGFPRRNNSSLAGVLGNFRWNQIYLPHNRKPSRQNIFRDGCIQSIIYANNRGWKTKSKTITSLWDCGTKIIIFIIESKSRLRPSLSDWNNVASKYSVGTKEYLWNLLDNMTRLRVHVRAWCMMNERKWISAHAISKFINTHRLIIYWIGYYRINASNRVSSLTAIPARIFALSFKTFSFNFIVFYLSTY